MWLTLGYQHGEMRRGRSKLARRGFKIRREAMTRFGGRGLSRRWHLDEHVEGGEVRAC